jgi:hypothetical protein
MSRRRSRRRSLAGLSSDTMVGLGLLAGGAALAWYLWKKNTPQGAMAGLVSAGCGCGK